VLAALAGLRPGTSCCPGTLARRLGTTPAVLRPILAPLAAAGRVRITQQGRPRDLATLRGPYRVAAAP
jgi:DNA-binding IscR family transcriptional regulator